MTFHGSALTRKLLSFNTILRSRHFRYEDRRGDDPLDGVARGSIAAAKTPGVILFIPRARQTTYKRSRRAWRSTENGV